MKEKPLAWLKGEIKTPPFSADARIEAEYLLRRLQRGEKLGLPHSRPMPTIGPRCHELRIRDRDHTWRIIYRLDVDVILILAIFDKKTATTAKATIDDCRRRLRHYEEHVRQVMRNVKRKKLEAAGWQVGSASQLLGLSKQEAELVELRLALARGLRLRREARKLTQARLAKLIGSSQSRVAKMEAADSTVALDLLFRSLVAMGATRRELAKIIQRPVSPSAA